MKFIHLSDLHLGKRIYETSLIDDQRYILGQILGIIDEEKPDGVLIAGDIYDKSFQPIDAVNLFNDFLIGAFILWIRNHVAAENTFHTSLSG